MLFLVNDALFHTTRVILCTVAFLWFTANIFSLVLQLCHRLKDVRQLFDHNSSILGSALSVSLAFDVMNCCIAANDVGLRISDIALWRLHYKFADQFPLKRNEMCDIKSQWNVNNCFLTFWLSTLNTQGDVQKYKSGQLM